MITKNNSGFKSVREKLAKCEGVSKEQSGSALEAAAKKVGVDLLYKNPRLKIIAGKEE